MPIQSRWLAVVVVVLLASAIACNRAASATRAPLAVPAPALPVGPEPPGAGAAADPRLTDISGLSLGKLQLPPGFHISVYARVNSARELAYDPDSGNLFIGSNSAKRVCAVTDANRDYQAERLVVLYQDLWLPVGVAFYQGDLYYSEVNAVWKAPGIISRLDDPPAPLKVADFPDKEHHGWKFIRIGPDGKLYVPVGVPCNICNYG